MCKCALPWQPFFEPWVQNVVAMVMHYLPRRNIDNIGTVRDALINYMYRYMYNKNTRIKGILHVL